MERSAVQQSLVRVKHSYTVSSCRPQSAGSDEGSGDRGEKWGVGKGTHGVAKHETPRRTAAAHTAHGSEVVRQVV